MKPTLIETYIFFEQLAEKVIVAGWLKRSLWLNGLKNSLWLKSLKIIVVVQFKMFLMIDNSKIILAV